MSPYVIGIDVGGTKIAAGLVAANGSVVAALRSPTPPGVDVTRAVTAAAQTLLEQSPATAVGVSVAGFVASDRATVAAAPNIRGWAPTGLGQDLSVSLGLPVLVENDANAAAWAEAVFGAGRGSTNMVCLTVGTGLGGGIVMNRRLYRGSSGFAAEFGHMVVVQDGDPCTCGRRGCWERYASGGALVRSYHRWSRNRASEPDNGQLTGADVTRAAVDGDSSAVAAFDEVGTWLGRGMGSLAAALDADLFVIGGGVAEAEELLLEPVRRTYAASLPHVQDRAPTAIVLAEMRNAAGLIGAAALARVRFA